uniref:Large ribosomal subunit protein bL20c n=1 Tax=Pedinomonas tuberculata TaxID=160064 RepID=A0A097KL80_9CHLO|nr:ribosomal protein L20 [Pedinomonas tuberculata]AIT93923.1 ribosomal protein L20 [Pedinomonas tuberculata]
MTRVKRGSVARNRRKKIFKMTEGFRGSGSSMFRMANQQNMKALRYAYRGRNERKRQIRSLWISRINAVAREYGLTYSTLIHKLKSLNILLNRKIISQLAIRDKEAFKQLITIL